MSRESHGQQACVDALVHDRRRDLRVRELAFARERELDEAFSRLAEKRRPTGEPFHDDAANVPSKPPEPVRLIPFDDAQRSVELLEDAGGLDVGTCVGYGHPHAANHSMVRHQTLLRGAHCVAPPAHGRPPVGAALGGGRLLPATYTAAMGW